LDEAVTPPAVRLANLDLNLLVTLRELLRERNVTRAAERVGVTQPAASAALSRLRRHFGDELLVRSKGEYELTPLAAQLAEQVEVVCAAAERLFATSTHFDPATSQREFTLLMADYTLALIGARLSQLAAATAPRARLHIRLVRGPLLAEIPDTIRLLDAMIAVTPVPPFEVLDVASVELFRDRWVCVVSRHNRLLDGGPLRLDDLARLPWVVPFYPGHGHHSAAPAPRQLTLLGLQPHVAVRVESYQAVPYFVTGTDRIALVQERLAHKFLHGPAADLPDLELRECPGDPEPIVEALWWHNSYQDDPAHTWLRQLIVKVAKEL